MKQWCGTALEDHLQGYELGRCCTQMLKANPGLGKKGGFRKQQDAFPENITARATHAVTCGTAGIGGRQGTAGV